VKSRRHSRNGWSALAGPWRWLGQWLPPGAGGTALRNTANFEDAALTQPLVVLAGFAFAGALLALGAERLRRLDRRHHGGAVVESQPGQPRRGADREPGEDLPAMRVDRPQSA